MPPRHSCRSRTIYPAELQPHILGPAVLREQQILYHDLRRIARRGGIFFADPVLRGAVAGDAHSRRGRWGVRRSAGKIPAVWSGGFALRPDVCRCEPGGHAVGRRPWQPFRLGGCPAAVWSGGPAVRPGVAILPCGRTFVGVNPADTPSAGAPGGRSVWGAARRPCVRRCQRAPIQSAWRASRRKTGMVASGAAAVTVRPPGWTAPVCSSVQSAPAGR